MNAQGGGGFRTITFDKNGHSSVARFPTMDAMADSQTTNQRRFLPR